MKTVFALPLLALGLAACQPYPEGPGGYPPPYPPPGYPPPQGEANYRALGTEPFWNLDIGRDIVFSNADGQRVVQPTPRPINGVAGEIYQTQRINVNIVHSRGCSDGMSDRTYPDSVQVRVDGREYRGCGAPADWYGWNNEGGSYLPPAGGSAVMLAQTNWRVISINGRPTPPNNFYVNFLPERLSAKFGCNSLGADYTQTGNTLSAGPVMATRMACPDMSFETQGSAVLSRDMNVTGIGDRVTLSNQRGTIELVRAR